MDECCYIQEGRPIVSVRKTAPLGKSSLKYGISVRLPGIHSTVAGHNKNPNQAAEALFSGRNPK